MTSTTETTSRVEHLLSDPFFDANTNVDLAGFTLEERAEIDRRLGRPEKAKDPFDALSPNVITNTRSVREEYAEMLRDPEVRAELAARNPEFAKQFEAEEIERIVTEFRRKNPDYLKTERNAEAVIQALAKKHLGKDWLDNDDAAAALYGAGYWSVAELTAQFKACLKAGQLDVRRGTTKQLSRQEELEVISIIRTGNLEGAIFRFVELSFCGKLPGYNSAEKFLANNSELASKAALFVWANNQPGIDLEEFKTFQKTKLPGISLLTYDLINRAWTEWKQASKRSYLFPNGIAPQASAPENLDELSDEELDSRLMKARRQARESLRG